MRRDGRRIILSEDLHDSNNEQKYRWECPDCGKIIKSWTDVGCAVLVKAHKLDHTMSKFAAPQLAMVKTGGLTPDDVLFLADLKVGW
jgi:ABC-type ATPase with predicted acetyltransferase domain